MERERERDGQKASCNSSVVFLLQRVQQVQRARAAMDGSGTPLKPSGHEQHAKLSAKFVELALPPLRRHFACEAEAEQRSKSFVLSLACSSWLLVFSKAAAK